MSLIESVPTMGTRQPFDSCRGEAHPDLAWHALPVDEALRRSGAAPTGLTEEEAERRLARHGPNRLEPPRRRGPLVRLLLQFNHLLIHVLLGAAIVTGLLGHWIDTAVILGVVLANTAIGFLQEGKAEKSLDAIRRMLSLTANVVRDGRRREVAAENLSPGDIVVLASGDKVPADLRLIETRNLRIDESALTGESAPVEKRTDAAAARAAIGDRTSMAYSGTLVTFGQGKGVVVATGPATEIGRIGGMLGQVETLTTPLLAKMSVFARGLTLIILGVAAASFPFGILIRGYSVDEMFLAAVGLAVAAIPEGLPAILTVTLAIGVQGMARRHAIVRRLPAVETLGSVTVICSDKTGTLTRNEMTVRQVITAECVFDVSGAGYAPRGGFAMAGRDVSPDDHPELAELARVAALCNDASIRQSDGHWNIEGDPTEGALLTLALKTGLDLKASASQLPRLDVIPFESEHRYMATLHRDHSGHAFILLKGAPEQVLAMCVAERREATDRPLDAGAWRHRIDTLAASGQRVLALAVRAVDSDKRTLRFEDADGGFTLLALVGIMDPPRDEAIAAVAQCRAAGIRVKMITGDHAVTACAIGAQLGIGDGRKALTGSHIEALDDRQLREAVAETDVFARASPEHKLRLVRALQANGEIVAMTGDGVNDAPALKRADVGVAMGIKGTEAAKEAAEVVLTDDNFASIAHAVEAGRTVYDNLRKAITFLLPVNGGESLTVLLAILLGATLPVTPAQILWVNMVSSVALALVLAFEPTEPDVMRRPPRPRQEGLLSRFLIWRIAFVASLFLLGVFGMFELALARGAPLDEARTVAVNTLVTMEVFYLFSVRYLRTRAFTFEGVRGTPRVLAAVFVVFGLQLAFTYAPFMASLFHSQPLGFEVGVQIVAVGATLLVVLEMEKSLRRRWFATR